MSNCCDSHCECKDNDDLATNKKIEIDFLYLDLSTCERCKISYANMEEALYDIEAVLKSAGYDITLNKLHISSIESAEKYEFISSPTIRINGNDISNGVAETACKECGDLCGDNVDCRVWLYEGVEYTEAPKAMIINAVLKYVYGEAEQGITEKKKYELPKNLENYFKGLERKRENISYNRSDLAVEKFKHGFNCAQSVLAAYTDMFKISENNLLKISNGFGAGMGRKQEMCGAVSGGIMVLGLLYGRGEFDEKSKQEKCYSKVKELINRFESIYETSNCFKLIDECDLTTAGGQERFKNENKIEKCWGYVKKTVEILENIIEK